MTAEYLPAMMRLNVVSLQESLHRISPNSGSNQDFHQQVQTKPACWDMFAEKYRVNLNRQRRMSALDAHVGNAL